MEMNIVGKEKKLNPEIFCYVLEKIFIVNLKNIWEMHFLWISRSKYRSQGQVLENYLELNSECIYEIFDEFPSWIYSFIHTCLKFYVW